ncbi:albumin-2-like [Vigna radiata var. radiata]|uniref:Albumin-2-like n=1 Tax=Vigna radiata var. radiata TaxID=3916 RepID=A0A1S3UY59_VIGRR|nr:albumin-2-like [Vigna radiata var. radiata]
MSDPYINAALRSSREYEVYFFAKNKYVRLKYTPGGYDEILTNLTLISSGFPSLAGTPFAEPGIDASFDTEASEAYVFSGNICAYIDYAPGTHNDKILAGPTTIAQMFPVLRNTVFADGIDSALRSTIGKEVYLFKGTKYVRIDYDSKQLVGSIRNIADGFPVLNGTIFESGIDACFASHKESEAYLFKGDKYVRFKFSPGTYDDTLIGDIKLILDGWSVLNGILPVN